jgi:hypothetical protein
MLIFFSLLSRFIMEVITGRWWLSSVAGRSIVLAATLVRAPGLKEF